MTKLRNLAPLLLLAFAPAAVLAEDYRFEVKGSFDRDMPSDDFYGDIDTLTFGGTWYFAPVSTDGVPLAEAAFLGRASSLSAIAAQFELFGTHLNSEAARVGYYLPGTMFYGAVGVARAEYITGLSSTTVLTDHDTTWFGTLGIAPLDGLLITTDFQEDGYDPNITARYVGKLPNDHFYAGSVSLTDPDGGDTSFGIDFDYFIDESFSIGAGYLDGGDQFGAGYADGGNQFELRAEKFFSKSWAVGASVSTADGGDGFGVRVTWRH